MASILTEILAEDDKEIPDYSKKIDSIKKAICKLKVVVNKTMKEKFAELESQIKPDEVLISKSDKLINKMVTLQSQIDEQIKVKLSSSAKELETLTAELTEHNYALAVSNQLLEIHRSFEAIKAYKTNDERYSSAANTLINLYSLVIEKSADIQELNIYEALKKEYHRLYDNFIEEINDSWLESVRWSEGSDTTTSKSVTLCINSDRDHLIDIIQALHCVRKLTKCIQSLSARLLKDFIKPVVSSNCNIVSTDKSLRIEVLHGEKEPPKYKTVLDNLKCLFHFLHSHFDIILENDECFIGKLSVSLLPEFSQTLTNDCISSIVPTSTSELKAFKLTVLEIEEFQNYLLDIKFINEEQKFLSTYTTNIDKLYIDKKCEKLLETARSIMKKDLHNSIRHEPNVMAMEELDDMKAEDTVLDRKLSKYYFHLPPCQISESAREIFDLVEEVLEEACKSSDKYALRLFYTSRNILEMYAALVPEVHKSLLKTIPQQAALFHNNCFYLAHRLLTVMCCCKYKMLMAQPRDCSLIFVDQVTLLRQVGTDHFLNHMKYQRDIIFDILRESGLALIGQIPKLFESTEKALQQCIRQLELLKAVWMDVLPIKVYCRAVGCIVTNMIGELSNSVTKVEDIPANIATELVFLFNTVVKKIPQIFPDPALIEQHVHKWRHLKELIIILGASLKDIEGRWADGKGPLAHEFPPHLVRKLIRALFQNTERRSNLLYKIKDKS